MKKRVLKIKMGRNINLNQQNKKSRENFIYSNFIEGIFYLGKIKKYFWFSVILFFVIGLVGFLFPIFFQEEILKLIQDLVKQTEGLGTLELINFIIFNNMKSAFFGMIFGIFLGLVPLGIIVVNGYVLGFVANKSVMVEGISVLWRLVPHGIFELPAIFISTALGLRLGMFLFFYRGKNRGAEFKKWFWNSLKVFILIVIPLLVIAGIIEGVLIGVVG